MPLDLIPINLFSTRSTLPIAFLPARIFNFWRRFTGDNFLPLTVIGSPFLNRWFKAFLAGFPIAVVAAAVMAPIAKKLTRQFTS